MKASVPELLAWSLMTLGALLWVVALARARALEWFTAPSRLPPWLPLLSEFLVFVLSVCVGTLFAVYGAVQLFKIDVTIEPVTARTALVTSFAMQASWLGVALGFRMMGMLRLEPGETRTFPAVIAGVGAFFLAVPAVELVQYLWQILLNVLHVAAPPQTVIDLIRHANTAGELLPWVVLVVIVVPVAEEVLFRHALYRFLSGHVPDAVAMVLSSALFGFMHTNTLSVFPLTVLGVALCLAYRYTGRLITPIAMHALFNLNSLLMVKLGP